MRRLPGIVTAFLGLLACTAPAFSQSSDPLSSPPGGGFGLPVDCAMGTTCTIQNYVDHDSGDGWLDHTCGPLSYNGHRGTDFRVPTQIDMHRGVAVIAAADGEVIIAKDGQPDLLMQDTGPGKTREERNGNWVAIRHGGGWVTTYAHLMKGTVSVTAGDRVARGDKLGLIGLSGNSDFPHVHFAVTHRNRLLDPFTGTEPSAACGVTETSLWSPAAEAQLAYRAGGLLSAGFLGRIPERREMLEGIRTPAQVSTDDRLLIFWAAVWGGRTGDIETLQILSPDGTTFFRKERVLDGNHAIWTTHFGVRRNNSDLVPGTYIGSYRLRRPNDGWSHTILTVRKTITVR